MRKPTPKKLDSPELTPSKKYKKRSVKKTTPKKKSV
jgi:hypothetical protein